MRTFPPEESEGWTISFIDRESRYWVEARAGLKDANLLAQGVKKAWAWAEPCECIRWFTDGERRYGKQLWKLASLYLPSDMTTDAYPYRRRQNHYAKVLEGLQRALNVQRRLLHNWVRPHWGLGNNTTPAMAMGFMERPIEIVEILTSRGFQCFTP